MTTQVTTADAKVSIPIAFYDPLVGRFTNLYSAPNEARVVVIERSRTPGPISELAMRHCGIGKDTLRKCPIPTNRCAGPVLQTEPKKRLSVVPDCRYAY